jgi:two-component system chemotaxis response regulator CheY
VTANNRRRVLVVEDSPVMRELFRMTFKGRAGVDLEHAGDGLAALQAVKASDRPYDLILLDLNMPVMDGMKFLGFLAEEKSAEKTVVAVVTTEHSAQAEKQARALGARYYLRKPVKRREIESIITDVIGDDD